MESSRPTLWKGVALMLCAWTLFALMSAFVKHSYNFTTPLVTFFFQNFGGFLFLTPYFFGKEFTWMKGGDWHLILLRGMLGGSSFLCLFYALTKIPLTDATLLNNTSPLFIPFLAAYFLKTPLRLPVLISTFVGFSGVMFILKPTGNVFCFEALPGLCAGALSAFVMVVMKKLSGKSPKQILFGYLGLTSLVSALFAIPKIPLLSLEAIMLLFCIGAFFGLGQLCLTWAFRHAEPTVLAPMSYIYVLVSVIIDWGFWHQAPSNTTAFGALFIFSGGLSTILYAQRKQISGHRAGIPPS